MVKCFYTAEEVPCHFCTRKNRECIKVFGPKKQDDIDLSSHGVHDPLRLGTSLSLIKDSGVDDQELYYVRNMHHIYSRQRTGCFAVILQNLCEIYGLTFKDKTLHYSVLAWATKPREDFYTAWPVSQQVDHYTYKSLFYQDLRTAIRQNSISECHLFALLFAILATENAEIEVYLKCLLAVVELLDKNDI